MAVYTVVLVNCQQDGRPVLVDLPGSIPGVDLNVWNAGTRPAIKHAAVIIMANLYLDYLPRGALVFLNGHDASGQPVLIVHAYLLLYFCSLYISLAYTSRGMSSFFKMLTRVTDIMIRNGGL